MQHPQRMGELEFFFRPRPVSSPFPHTIDRNAFLCLLTSLGAVAAVAVIFALPTIDAIAAVAAIAVIVTVTTTVFYCAL